MIPLPQVLIAACAALLCDCCPAASAEAAPASETLIYENGSLYLDDGERSLLDSGTEYDSFALLHCGASLVLSSLDDELVPHCWMLGPDEAAAPLSLPGRLPFFVSEHYAAFTGLASGSFDTVNPLSIVSSAGELLLDDDHSQLLLPAAGSLPAAEACLFGWSGTDEMEQFFIDPGLRIISSADGAVVADWKLDLPAAPSEVQLLCMDSSAGLLLVLYDIYNWQVVQLDRRSGDSRIVYTLQGQPMYDTYLPSGANELSRAVLNAGRLELDVISLADGAQTLSFDPLAGQLEIIPQNGNMPGYVNDEMIPPSALIGHFHLSQEVMPLTSGANWSMPAYRDQHGSLLLLTGNGPIWMKVE